MRTSSASPRSPAAELNPTSRSSGTGRRGGPSNSTRTPRSTSAISTSCRATYEAFWHLDVTVDFVRPDADLSAYKVVAIPSLYLVSDSAAANLTRYVEAGGQLVCNFFSGIVDPNDAVRLGGYPGAFRQLLGVRVEEFYPLLEHQTVTLADGGTGRVWTELLTPVGGAGCHDVRRRPAARLARDHPPRRRSRRCPLRHDVS